MGGLGGVLGAVLAVLAVVVMGGCSEGSNGREAAAGGTVGASGSGAFAIETDGATYRVDIDTGALTEIMRFPAELASDMPGIYTHQYGVSADGRLVAATCDDAGIARASRASDQFCIYDSPGPPTRVITLPDDVPSPWTIGKAYSQGNPFWFSPDSRWLLFSVAVPDSKGELAAEDLYVTDLRDGSVRLVLEHEGDEALTRPQWSPDSRRFAIGHQGRDGYGTDAAVIEVATGARVAVADIDGVLSVRDPIAWSPDGSALAFMVLKDDASGNATTHVYVVNADGSGTREAPTGGMEPIASYLAWSPDGEWLAANFIVERRDDGRIVQMEAYAMHLAGTERIALGANGVIAWSRDGNEVAVWGEVNGRYALAMTRLDGTGPSLTETDKRGGGPLSRYGDGFVWDPAGSEIYYTERLCGKGGCSNQPLHRLEEGSRTPVQVTATGAYFLGLLTGGA